MSFLRPLQSQGRAPGFSSLFPGAQTNTSPKSADIGAPTVCPGGDLAPGCIRDCNLNLSAYASHALAKSSAEIDTSDRLRASQGALSKRFFCARSFMVGVVRALRSAVFSEYGSVNLVAPATCGLTPMGGGSQNSEDPRHVCAHFAAPARNPRLSRWFHNLRLPNLSNSCQARADLSAWFRGAENHQRGFRV